MGIVLWVVLGIAAGSVAKLVMPGPSAGGLAVAIPLGVGGALIGGFLGVFFLAGTVTGVDFTSLLMAICGSLIVLLSYRSYAMRENEVIFPRQP